MSFSAELKAERERQGVSLETMAAASKLSRRHLEAFEGGRYGELPGGVYTKGVVKYYCRHLGLDEAEWMAKFPALRDADSPVEWAEFAENVKRNRGGLGPALGWRWMLVILLLVAVGIGGWYAWTRVIEPRVHGNVLHSQ